MSTIERKNSVLPCKIKLSSSWAALRKCWTGFKICLSKGDRKGMSDFAFGIRKLGRQMGIEITDFDLDILSAETVDYIDRTYTPLDYGISQKEPAEREIDYDSIFDEASGQASNVNAAPHPRKAIFTTYVSRIEKSCPPENPVKITRHSTNYERSCPLGNPGMPAASSTVNTGIISYPHDRTCFISDGDQTIDKGLASNHVSSPVTKQDDLAEFASINALNEENDHALQNDPRWRGYPNNNSNTVNGPSKNKNKKKNKRRKKSCFYQQEVPSAIKRDGNCFHISQV